MPQIDNVRRRSTPHPSRSPHRRSRPVPSRNVPRRITQPKVPSKYRPRRIAPRYPLQLPRQVEKALQDFQSNAKRLSDASRAAKSVQLGAIGYVLEMEHLYRASFTEAEHFENLGDWSLVAQCGSAPTGQLVAIARGNSPTGATVIGNVNSCLLNQAYPLGPHTGAAIWAYPLDSSRSLVVGTMLPSPPAAANRAMAYQAYSRPVAGAFTEPTYVPAVNWKVVALVAPLPWRVDVKRTLDPMYQPVAQVAPLLAPAVPYWFNPYWTHPQRVVSNGLPRLAPSFVRKDWERNFSNRPIRGTSKYHRRSRPPSNEREKKAKMGAAAVAAIKLISAFTETQDFIESLYKALPEKYRTRWKDTPYEKRKANSVEQMRALYDHYQHINISDAFLNLLYNQIEDKVYGTIGRQNAEVSKRLGWAYGAGLNTFNSNQRKLYDQYRKYQQPEE